MLDLPPTSTDIVLEILSALGVLVQIYLIVSGWSSLPETIPTHFNARGEPDSWGSKWTLLIPLAIGLGVYALMTITSRYPHAFNYLTKITEENAERQYRLARRLMLLLKLEIAWMFAYIAWTVVRFAQGHDDQLGILFLVVIVVVIQGTLGTYIWKSIRAR